MPPEIRPPPVDVMRACARLPGGLHCWPTDALTSMSRQLFATVASTRTSLVTLIDADAATLATMSAPVRISASAEAPLPLKRRPKLSMSAVAIAVSWPCAMTWRL